MSEGTPVLAGKVAVVTGAGGGIGRAIARRFASAGAVAVCADIDIGRAAETAAALGAMGGAGFALALDVADERSAQEAIDHVVADRGGVDILVNNAGVATRSKPLHDLTSEEWERVLAVNLTGTFFCTKAALPAMLSQGSGVILNIASALARVAPPVELYRVANYAASKGGVLALTRATAAEYAREGIRANAIVPGWISDTRLGQADREAGLDEEAIERELESRIAAGRLGTPSEVADVALYLASESSAFVTGAVVDVDGGWLAA